MSEELVRAVLREHAESVMPGGQEPWPAIKRIIQTRHLENASAPFRVNMAMALIALIALAALSIFFIMGIRSQVSPLQSGENAFVPTGKVRHMVLTGTYSVEGGPGN